MYWVSVFPVGYPVLDLTSRINQVKQLDPTFSSLLVGLDVCLISRPPNHHRKPLLGHEVKVEPVILLGLGGAHPT